MLTCNNELCLDDCDDCIAEAEYLALMAEQSTSCPHRKECKVVLSALLTGKCTTCNKTFTYT